VLKKVNYLHSITHLEKESLKQEFRGIPQITIPNGLGNTEIQQYSVPARPEKFFLFVGRLHPMKGVDVLIRAFDQAHLDAKWQLLIVGPDYDPSYGKSLRNLARSLEIEDRVVFKGAIFGEEKNLLFSTAWATIVPSYSEVVSLVNLESAAAFTPTITTYSTGLEDWGESGGILVAPNVNQLAGALSRVASWSIEERMRRGQVAHRFVRERYSWEVIGKEWLDSYRLISQGG
jgi:glycosyltransferase involved in cell wall biosynthesis